MTAMWLEELLPEAMVSARNKAWWIAFLALFPLAYVGGVMLDIAQESPARIVGSQDRAASIRTAEDFAASKGFEVANWRPYAIVDTHDNLVAYYKNETNRDTAAVSAIAPAREVQVLFRSPDQSQDFRVYLSVTGHVTGYDFGKSVEHLENFKKGGGVVRVESNTTSDADAVVVNGGSTKTSAEQAAEALARGEVTENSTLNRLVKLGPARITRNTDDASEYGVAWDANPANTKGLTLHITASVRKSKVVAEHIEADVDREHVVEKPKLESFLNGLYGFFLTFGAFYAMYRYVKRTLQKEVSHARTLLVAGLFAAFFSLFAYSFGIDQIASGISGPQFTKTAIYLYVGAGIMCAVAGLLVGIGYGSGEGELREAYPGKLTSLDALLSGRIFSRDVALSFLFGAAAAGWLMLGQHALSFFVHSDITASQSHALTYTFARFPWLTLVLGRQYDSLLIAVAGLLLPAAFLSRRAIRRQRRLIWLVLFALLAVLGDTAKYPTVALALLSMVVLASALLLPFFAFDLLAAIVSLSALAFANEVITLAEVVPSWTTFALILGGLAVGALALAVYLALNGRRVQEEEVRPRYAKNQAERMAMQAEILAAREAQLRLLPQAAPELPGIQLAACCLPARGLGGDFYDFFRLDANRIGIFVAQGGDEGLASALCIALAKGLLMHASQQSHTPTQIIEGLERSIAELLEHGTGAGISFAYGVMDTRVNLLKYARIGTSPRVMIYREGAGLTASPQLEREVSKPGRLKTTATIYEGAAQGHPGDFLLFVTEGLMSLRTRRFGKPDYRRVHSLMRELGKPDDPLQTSLTTAMSKYQKQASEDLTAVVLRITERQVLQQEVVA